MTIHRRNVDRPARPGRIAMAVLSIGAVAALSACDNGDNSSQNGTDSSAAAASSGDKGTAESSAAPAIKDVNAADFRSGPSYLFTYQIDGGKKGECFVAETGLGCTGTVAKDVPDVVVPPFEQQRPGAVFANSEGPDYGIFEGVPPAKKPLQPGERITVGTSQCTLTSDKLECWVGKRGDNNGFTIEGADRAITTMKTPLGTSFVGEGATSAVRPQAKGNRCGTIRSTQFPPFDGASVNVLNGDVPCDKAVSVMDEYVNTPPDGMHGNANVRTIQGWSCNMPTAAAMDADGLAAVCTDRSTGGKIGVPVE
ncbi:hypothetical protein [Corynebacterium falsenii]